MLIFVVSPIVGYFFAAVFEGYGLLDGIASS